MILHPHSLFSWMAIQRAHGHDLNEQQEQRTQAFARRPHVGAATRLPEIDSQAITLHCTQSMALIFFAFVCFTVRWRKTKENFRDPYAHGLLPAASYYSWELQCNVMGFCPLPPGQDKEATISSLGILLLIVISRQYVAHPSLPPSLLSEFSHKQAIHFNRSRELNPKIVQRPRMRLSCEFSLVLHFALAWHGPLFSNQTSCKWLRAQRTGRSFLSRIDPWR